MCHFAVLYALQVLRSVANYYIHSADARFGNADSPSYEYIARFFMDGLMTDSRRPGVLDYVTPAIEDEEEPHQWYLRGIVHKFLIVL